jgi:hypothetical protein
VAEEGRVRVDGRGGARTARGGDTRSVSQPGAIAGAGR